jgi:hypothetical protein
MAVLFFQLQALPFLLLLTLLITLLQRCAADLKELSCNSSSIILSSSIRAVAAAAVSPLLPTVCRAQQHAPCLLHLLLLLLAVKA